LLRDQIASGRKVSFQDMQAFQANVQQLDAELLTPHLLAAVERARAAGAPPALARLAADPEVAEAIARIATWDFSSPTGVPDGYDASDKNGRRAKVSRAEADASVAATLYNVWRAKLVRRVVDATLTRVGVSPVTSMDALKATFNLLRRSPFTGVGASGIDFFPSPTELASAADRRDATLLSTMREALDALASDDFAVAFARSRNQADYRWGKLHRITFDHPFVPQFSIPPAAGFNDFAPGLPGLSRDGAYEVVNQSGFSATADRPQDFMFGFGPNRRYVGEVRSRHQPLPDMLSATDPLGANAQVDASNQIDMSVQVDAATETDATSMGKRPPGGGPGVNGVNVIPGGPSGDPLSDRYATQLPDWLTADYHQVSIATPNGRALSDERFVPPGQ
jgi:penicillin G amidase